MFAEEKEKLLEDIFGNIRMINNILEVEILLFLCINRILKYFKKKCYFHYRGDLNEKKSSNICSCIY